MIQNFLSKIWMFCPALQFVDLFARIERKTLTMKLANYFEIYKLLAFRVEKSYFASIIRVTRLWSTRHSLIINTWVWVTRFRQFTIIEPTSIIKFYIHWQKTWISGFSCKSKLVPSATFSSHQPTFLGSYEYTYSFSVSSH